MIGHPKLDPVSGELFALSSTSSRSPYFKFSADDFEIPLDEPTMMHDFAITEKSVVIPDQQEEMIRGGSPVVARLGILDKNARDALEIKWIEAQDCFCFHLWNAWEEPETDELVVIGYDNGGLYFHDNF